jgi:hypothetical protein
VSPLSFDIEDAFDLAGGFEGTTLIGPPVTGVSPSDVQIGSRAARDS